MSWRIEDHPERGLQIAHLVAPRFTARWTTGEFPIDDVRDGAFFWTDVGRSEEDAVHLYGYDWIDPVPSRAVFERLMHTAIIKVEDRITGCL